MYISSLYVERYVLTEIKIIIIIIKTSVLKRSLPKTEWTEKAPSFESRRRENRGAESAESGGEWGANNAFLVYLRSTEHFW